MPPAKTQRNKAIIAAYLAGESPSSLAAEYGLCGQRIRAILHKAGASRPRPESKGPRAQIGIRLTAEQADALDRLQDLTGETQAEAIALAVQERLARLEAK